MTIVTCCQVSFPGGPQDRLWPKLEELDLSPFDQSITLSLIFWFGLNILSTTFLIIHINIFILLRLLELLTLSDCLVSDLERISK